MNTTRTTRGFTLLELIVSVGLFTIVVTIAMSAYLALIALDRKARATNDIVANLSFVVEDMSRAIRTGSSYNCDSGPNCNPGEKFTFINDNCQSVTYLAKTDGTIGQCVGTADTSGSCSPSPVTCTVSSATSITDPRIDVTNMKFYAQGIGTSDGLQPRVIFTLTGAIVPDENSSAVTFTIEGGATQRLIELEP